MKQVWIPRAGAPGVLEVRETADPQPAPGTVRIRVEFAGINFADIMGRLGIYPDLPPMPVVVGYEVSGTVDAVGAGVSDNWIGKPVLALCRFGGYSSCICVPEIQVHELPEGMSPEAAAALPVNYLTAYQLVEVMGGLKAHETMLVHSAGGGVGIAAIQLARRIGARVIGTASSGKHQRLRELGVDECIDYRREDFAERVRQLTGGRGVELILDAVGGDSFRKGFDILAPTGRLGMFGMSAAATGDRRSLLGIGKALWQMPKLLFNPPNLMNHNRAVFGVNVGHLWDEAEMVNRWVVALLGYYRDGQVQPVVDRSFPFEQADAAHQYIQERKNFGKVLLTP